MSEGPTVVILQSSYIPWRGYFGLIAAADTFVFLDSVQFTRRDWRSRNRIKTANGLQWLTIPVQTKGNYHAAIDEMEVVGGDWIDKHLTAIRGAYGRSPEFDATFPVLEAAYASCAGLDRLSEINIRLIRTVCDAMGLGSRLVRDVELLPRQTLLGSDPTERLARLCEAAGGRRYISGPAARSYLQEAVFTERGTSVAWADYGSLPEYPQLWGPFEAQVSVIDAMLNLGPAGARSMLGAPVS